MRIVLQEVLAQFTRLNRLRLENAPALQRSDLLMLLVRSDRFFQGLSNDQFARPTVRVQAVLSNVQSSSWFLFLIHEAGAMMCVPLLLDW